MAHNFKPKREGPRDHLFAAMPPLEAKKSLFAFVAGMREKRRPQGRDGVKLMFIDVKKAHFNAKCDEEEWVALPDEFEKFGMYAKLKRLLYGMRKAASGWEDDYARRLVEDGFRLCRAASTILYHKKDAGPCRRARRRLHVCQHRVRVEDNSGKDARVV